MARLAWGIPIPIGCDDMSGVLIQVLYLTLAFVCLQGLKKFTKIQTA